MKQTGAIVTADQELQKLSVLFERWKKDELDTVSMSYLVQKTAKKLFSKACYCQENVCCQVHSAHVQPHQNCVLR